MKQIKEIIYHRLLGIYTYNGQHYRRLETGEITMRGDMYNAKINPLYSGWVQELCDNGSVKPSDQIYYYRHV